MSEVNFKSDVEAVEALRAKFNLLNQEISKVIIGQQEVINKVLISIFSGGHVLLVNFWDFHIFSFDVFI